MNGVVVNLVAFSLSHISCSLEANPSFWNQTSALGCFYPIELNTNNGQII